MPANYRVKHVQFKTKREAAAHSTWSAHFDGCGREVIRALELLAKNNPDRWVYITVPKLTKMCNGKFRSGKHEGKAYSQFSVEMALQTLRDDNIVSRKLGIAPSGRTENGFIVAPHDALTRRHPGSCNFVGLKNASGTFVIRDGNGAWLRNPESDTAESFGLVQENGAGVGAGIEADAEADSEADSEAGTRAGVGAGGVLRDLADSEIDTDEVHELFTPENTPNLNSSLVSQLNLLNHVNHSNPGESGSHGDQYEEANQGQGKTEATSTSTSLVTHSQNRGGIASYFENADDQILLVTDGLVTRPPARDPDDSGGSYSQHYRQQKFDARYNEHMMLNMHVAQAVREMGDQELVDRKTLATIMNRTIAIAGGRAPKHFFKTMKDFQEQGGKITYEKPNSRPKKPVAKWDLENFGTYREAWQALKDDPDVPRQVLDQYYDGDALPDKPPASWR